MLLTTGYTPLCILGAYRRVWFMRYTPGISPEWCDFSYIYLIFDFSFAKLELCMWFLCAKQVWKFKSVPDSPRVKLELLCFYYKALNCKVTFNYMLSTFWIVMNVIIIKQGSNLFVRFIGVSTLSHTGAPEHAYRPWGQIGIARQIENLGQTDVCHRL